MNKIKSILSFLSNQKYLLVLGIFVLLIGFIDENSIMNRLEMRYQISALKQEIRDLRFLNDRDSISLYRLNTDIREVRKVAREQYLMKRPNEDVFVFIDSTQMRINN